MSQPQEQQPSQPQQQQAAQPIAVNNDAADMPATTMFLQQGTIAPCLYCREIYPGRFSGKPQDCPRCAGQGPRFRAARMMDRRTSSLQLLQEVIGLCEMEDLLNDDNDQKEAQRTALLKYKARLVALYEDVQLHQFSIAEALREKIFELDSMGELKPEDKF